MLKPCAEWAEKLSAYLDNEIDKYERQQVEAHLRECAACRATAELYTCDAQDAAAALHARKASDDFSARVMQQVRVAMIEPVAVKAPPAPVITLPKPKPGWRFGLIEALATVAAVAVLAAMIFPVFAKAREKARQPTCMNNVRQIVTAIEMYTQDNNEILPPADNWVSTVKKNVGNSEVFRCPTDSNNDRDHVSYAYNYAVAGKPLGVIGSQADIIPLIWDTAPRHNGGIQIGFADGHCGWRSAKDYVMYTMTDSLLTQPLASLQFRTQETKVASIPKARLKELAHDNIQPEKNLGQADKPPLIPSIGPPEKNYGLADKLQIAYKAEMSLQCADVRSSLESAELLFRHFDGYTLTSSYQREEDGSATAAVSGRVPAEQLGKLLVELDALGLLISRKVNGEDLTESHLEHLNTLSNLAYGQGRLEKQAAETSNPAEKATIEKQQESKSAEAFTTQMGEYTLKSHVVLAEVSVQLASLPKHVEPAPKVDSIHESVKKSLQSLTAFGYWLGSILLTVLIWLPVWGGLLWLVLYVRKRLKG